MGKYTLYLAAVVLAVAVFECAFAYPRYIAIPIEDVEFLSALPTRHRRQAPGFGGPRPGGAYRRPQPVALIPANDRAEIDAPVDDPSIPDDRFARSPGGYGGGRYVDYGAYTGSKGAFGWYTDHPVGKGY